MNSIIWEEISRDKPKLDLGSSTRHREDTFTPFPTKHTHSERERGYFHSICKKAENWSRYLQLHYWKHFLEPKCNILSLCISFHKLDLQIGWLINVNNSMLLFSSYAFLISGFIVNAFFKNTKHPKYSKFYWNLYILLGSFHDILPIHDWTYIYLLWAQSFGDKRLCLLGVIDVYPRSWILSWREIN